MGVSAFRYRTMITVITAYRHLLADIREISGIPFGEPDVITMAWVTIEGPALDKELLKYIEGAGHVPECPEWLSPLWTSVLSSIGDPLRDHPARDSAFLLRLLRQLLLFGYKLEFEPTDEQVKAAIAAFVETDTSIDVFNLNLERDLGDHTPLFVAARRYVGRVTYQCNFNDIIPSHGPGAVFPTSRRSDKALMSSIYASIQHYYDYWEYMDLPMADLDTVQHRLIEEKAYIQSKLTFVPKDSRGPRNICVHPLEAIWIQQGQRRVLERAIQQRLGDRINFRNQTLNARLALSSSRDRDFCTLDLKDASDRLSSKLVSYLFGGNYRYFNATRASHVQLPDGRVHRLRKFAPMGNCLTFPVQSICFYSVVRAGILCYYGENCSDIYVFGDDILFPSKYYAGVVAALVRAGLVVNAHKSFYRGFFRESCGVDAYNGGDVTPLRWKKWDPSSLSSAISLSTFAKNLRLHGYTITSGYMYKLLRQHWGPLPIGNNPDASGIYEYVDRDLGYLFRNGVVKYNRALQKWQTPIIQGVPVLEQGAFPHDRRRVLESILFVTQRGDNYTVRKDCAEEDGSDAVAYAIPRRIRKMRGWLDVLPK